MYPHDYPNAYVAQNYMPSPIVGKAYYKPKNNKFEKAIDEYMKKIKE